MHMASLLGNAGPWDDVLSWGREITGEGGPVAYLPPSTPEEKHFKHDFFFQP